MEKIDINDLKEIIGIALIKKLAERFGSQRISFRAVLKDIVKSNLKEILPTTKNITELAKKTIYSDRSLRRMKSELKKSGQK